VLNERHKYDPGFHAFAQDDRELTASVRGGMAADTGSWQRAVWLTYETAIRTLFYKAWRQKVGEATAEQKKTFALADAGLIGTGPADKPDYTWVNLVGRQAGAGMQRPGR
jgi:hypothetical protein